VEHLCLSAGGDELHRTVVPAIDLDHTHPWPDDIPGVVCLRLVPPVYQPAGRDVFDLEGARLLWARVNAQALTTPSVNDDGELIVVPLAAFSPWLLPLLRIARLVLARTAGALAPHGRSFEGQLAQVHVEWS